MNAGSPMPGATLGRYEIQSRIASGGMADVWMARATGANGFRKRIVIKTILPHLERDPEFVRMFINEALVASGLNHPHIVQIFDLGERDGHHFIAMEYVPGRSLRQITKAFRAKGERIPTWFVLEAMTAVCEALQYAHDYRDENGAPLDLVHRDISPENVMVSYAGTVKVLDFGVAKASQVKGSTQAGVIKGKHAYMAPECFEERVDRRTDIFALGVVLYELLTGTRPYRANNVLELMWQIVQTTPQRPSEIIPGFPRELESIIFDALERDPDRRIGQAAELQGRIEHYLDNHGGRSPSHALGDLVRGLFPDDPEAQSSGAPISRRAGEKTARSQRPDRATPVTVRSPTPQPSSPRKNPFTAHRESDSARRAIWPSGRHDDHSADAEASHPNEASPSPPPAPKSALSADAKTRATEHFELGLAYVRRGLMDDALREWQAAIELDPGNRDCETNIQRLKKRLASREPG